MSRIKLKELAKGNNKGIIGGPFGSKLTSKDYSNQGIPVIRGGNLNGGKYISNDDFVFVSKEKYNQDLRSNTAYPGDIIFTQRGTLGQVALIPKDSPYPFYVISQSQMKMTVDEKKADKDFIYYYFTSNKAIQEIKNHTITSGIPHINLSILRNFRIPDIKLEKQKYVSSFLSAFDNLIQNNTRRIEILEEMARLIYREWFVHYRYPDHENDKLVDSGTDLGEIPEGWGVDMFKNHLSINNGHAFKSEDYSKKGVILIRTRDFSSMGYIDVEDEIFLEKPLKEKFKKFLLQELDFLVIMVGASLGKYGIVYPKDIPALQNQNMWAIRPKKNTKLDRYYIISFMPDFIESIKSFATGAARSYFRKGHFQDQNIVLPPEMVLNEFRNKIEPIYKEIGVLLNKNEKLKETRDLLLPKLISGKLEV